MWASGGSQRNLRNTDCTSRATTIQKFALPLARLTPPSAVGYNFISSAAWTRMLTHCNRGFT
jgi:hypothetical protein